MGKPNDKERKKGRNKEGRGPRPDKHNLKKIKNFRKTKPQSEKRTREREYPSLPMKTREVDESDRRRRAKGEGRGEANHYALAVKTLPVIARANNSIFAHRRPRCLASLARPKNEQPRR